MVALVALAAAVTAAVGMLSGVAAAQDEGTSIGGRITRSPDAASGERAPVEGVQLVVRQRGREIGRDRTDADGAWRVPVPGAGTYEVRLVTDTLPEGVSLRDADRDTLPNVEIRDGQHKNVLFPLGTGDAGGGRSWGERFDRGADLAANGLKVGAIVALAAIGLSLIFGITGLVNFAHGELVTIGAVSAWWFNASTGGPELPLLVAGVFGIAAGALVGFALERGLFGPLRRRRFSTIALMVVSIGLSQFLRHVVLFFYGGSPRRYTDYAVQRSTEIGPIAMPPKDIVITIVALAVLVAIGVLLKTTPLGTAMRAVADNRDLAESSGIDVQRIILVTWTAGAGFAAFGGILQATSQTVAWDLGNTLLLTMFAAMILGGLGSVYGAMVGGVVIGIVSELSTYWLETEFKYATALAVLILVLLVRPQGILGIRERVG